MMTVIGGLEVEWHEIGCWTQFVLSS